jgi:hypothetical protein
MPPTAMRPSRTRSLLVFALVASVVTPVWVAGQARAVAPGQVSMSLVSESTWNDFTRPLRIRVRVRNDSPTAIDRLAIVLTIEARAGARSVYQLSVHQAATAVLHSFVFQERGAIAPGASRTIFLRQPLKNLALVSDNGIYPLQIQLLSGESIMATLRTSMVFLIETPENPLHITWTWVLDEPLQTDPNGVFEPGPMEGDIAPGGRLDAMVNAINDATPGAIDLVVSTVLVDQLDRMSNGYRIRGPDGALRTVRPDTGGAADAAHLLGLLRRIAGRPGTQLVAQPFSDARVPALLRAGLGDDLPTLLDRGRRLVASVLGAQPVQDVFHPPLSQIETPSADRLAALGESTLLLDSGSIPVQAGLTPNPPPVIRLSGGHHPIRVVLPDAEMVSVAQPFGDDPTLQARVALGELAAVWLEFPGTPGRGVAVLLGESPGYAAQFFRSFATLVRDSPWLRPVTASAMTSIVSSPGRASLPRRKFAALSEVVVNRVLAARDRLRLFASTAQRSTGMLARLRSALLLAEGGESVNRPAVGLGLANWVMGQIDATYRRVLPPQSGHIFTLLSRRGSIPLTMRNDNAFPMRVAVRFVTDHRVGFPKGNIQTLTLPPKGVIHFLVAVRAATTGRFPVKLQVFPPGTACGGCLIAESDVIVRSTAYNRVALVLTIGAGLFLLGWWGRRFLPRRTT